MLNMILLPFLVEYHFINASFNHDATCTNAGRLRDSSGSPAKIPSGFLRAKADGPNN